jgi:uncharacterized protein HemY
MQFKDPALRDPARALALARRAVELKPAEPSHWSTLGQALCRNHRWQEGLDALRKAMEMTGGGEASEWFHVAIALRKLDRAEEARAFYEKGARSMEEAPAGADAAFGARIRDDAMLERLRREAAAALGLEDEDAGG